MEVSFLPAVLIVGLLEGWSAGQDADPSNVIAAFDIARGGDAMVLPGTVNGKTVMFLVDTGSGQNALDKTQLPAQPKETTKLFTPNGGTIERHKYELPLTSIGGQSILHRLPGLRDSRDGVPTPACHSS